MTLTAAFCNFDSPPKKKVVLAFGLHLKYSRATEKIGIRGTTELTHQKCCTLRKFANLFKFCFRSKTTAKSSTVMSALLSACSVFH